MNRIYKKKFWKTLFFSYLTILVFSLLIDAILFRSSLERIEKSVAESSRTALLKVSDSISHMESELSAVTNNFLAREEYLSLLYAKRDLSSYKIQRVADLQDELKRQVAYNNFISAIYIWFENSQLAATTSGYYKTSADFDGMLLKEYGVTLDELRGWMHGYREIVVCPVDGGDGVNEQLLAVTCGAQDSNGTASIIVMKLRLDAVWRVLEGNDIERFWLQSLRNGGILAPRGGEELAVSLRDWTPEPNQTSDKLPSFDFDGETLALMRTESGSNFAVYSARNFDSYTETQRQYALVCAVFLLVYLALGIAMSFLLSRYNYQPIERLNSLLLRWTDGGAGGDLAMLEAGVNTLLRYYQDYEHEKFQLEKEQKTRWLLSLFLGEQPEGSDFAGVLQKCGLDLSAKQFAAVGVSVADYSNLFFDKGFAQDNEAFEVTMTALYSISEELLGHCGPVCLCRYDGKLWALVGAGPGADKPEWRARVRSACASAEAFARERLGIITYYYVEEIAKPLRPQKLHSAFRELRWGLEQMESYSLKQAVAGRAEIEKLIRPETPLPPEDVSVKRKQLFSAVTAGDLVDADRIYLELRQLDTAFSDGSFSTVRAQSLILMGFFISFLPKNLADANQEAIRRFMDSIRAEQRDEGLIAQMHQWMEFYHTIWKSSQPEAEGADAAAAAASYVLGHYTDANLSVALVAEELGVSTSYLSRIFRKKYDMSVLDYIHRQRINAAKVFIRESSNTLETIAGLVGYSNSLALIRAFKRCEGCTPTEYRRTLQEEGNGGKSVDA